MRGESIWSMPDRAWAAGACVVLGVCALAACVSSPPMQRVSLDLAPAPVAVFVDGEAGATQIAPGGEQTIALRSDTPHILYFKRDGYRSTQVVLETTPVDGIPRLRPDRVVVRLEPLTEIRRELTVELDD